MQKIILLIFKLTKDGEATVNSKNLFISTVIDQIISCMLDSKHGTGCSATEMETLASGYQ